MYCVCTQTCNHTSVGTCGSAIKIPRRILMRKKTKRQEQTSPNPTKQRKQHIVSSPSLGTLGLEAQGDILAQKKLKGI